MKKKARKRSTEEVLARWVERDLSAACAAGELSPAFGVKETIARVEDLLSAERHVILTGDAGVGKTAIVYELVRRAQSGEGAEALAGKRVLQFSLRRRAAGLRKAQEMKPEMHELVDALLEGEKAIVPFFRDVHLAYGLDLEAQLYALALRRSSPILGEGKAAVVQAMFECCPELEEHFAALPVVEPDIEQLSAILDAWGAWRVEERDEHVSAEAIDEAMYLTQRFLARSHQPRMALELLGQLAPGSGSDRPVGRREVMERFCRNHQVPRFLVDSAVRLHVEELAGKFRERLLGQEEAVRAMVRMVGRIKAGLCDVNRPLGAFLFVGPTGVGKTYLAKLLAELLLGNKDRLIRLNMADYQTDFDMDVLFGDADACGAAQQRGVLTQRLAGHPFTVLLLDEFEKAHPLVHDRFLQLMDEGRFINGAGETVACRSTIILATSNAGCELYRGKTLGFSDAADGSRLEQELRGRVQRAFRFELLNRFDDVVIFRPLSRAETRRIAAREVEAVRERIGIKQRGLEVRVEEEALDWLAQRGYDASYGARSLRRAVERYAVTALAEAIVRAEPARGSRLVVGVRGEGLVVEVEGGDGAEADGQEVSEGQLVGVSVQC